MSTIKNRLKFLRTNKGITQDELAQIINKELKEFFYTLNFKVDESGILSFIADIITYRVYKILKEKEKENIKVYNKKEIMSSHPCKYIFMLGEEDYTTEEWLG